MKATSSKKKYSTEKPTNKSTVKSTNKSVKTSVKNSEKLSDNNLDITSFTSIAKQLNTTCNELSNEKNVQIAHTRLIGSFRNKLCVMFVPNFLNEDYADRLFEDLKKVKYNSDEDSKVKIMGKEMYIPRKQIAFGDPTATYHFAGASVGAYDWCKDDNSVNSRVGRELMMIANKVSRMAGKNYNYVLVNNYLDQSNSIGYHSDDERELGDFPAIAGISLGQEREIYFKSNLTGEVVKLSLPHNSLYVMFYPTNKFWKHSIPKTAKPLDQRISLTYRHIHTN